MIRYAISAAELDARIDALRPGWRARAATKTAAYRAAGRYLPDEGTIWSEIKRVFMDLQGFKCGFCERRLEHSEFGNLEHDVEHFRPKSTVSTWPPNGHEDRADGLTFSFGDPTDTGYFLLAHHPDNYLISCKTCNSAFKGAAFPVAGTRQVDLDDVRASPITERPFLCYPIGSIDEDPQRLITFQGYLPVPAAHNGPRWRRGQVIIRFFDLAVREGLIFERSMIITTLFLALEARGNPPSALVELAASTVIDAARADTAPHANCARSFVRTWESDRALATTFADAAMEYLVGV